MIVFHIAVTAAADYLTRRERTGASTSARLQGLRANGILDRRRPSADGATADLFYRLQQPAQLKHAMEEDPYWTGGVWTRYEPRSLASSSSRGRWCRSCSTARAGSRSSRVRWPSTTWRSSR